MYRSAGGQRVCFCAKCTKWNALSWSWRSYVVASKSALTTKGNFFIECHLTSYLLSSFFLNAIVAGSWFAEDVVCGSSRFEPTDNTTDSPNSTDRCLHALTEDNIRWCQRFIILKLSLIAIPNGWKACMFRKNKVCQCYLKLIFLLFSVRSLPLIYHSCLSYHMRNITFISIL